MNGVVQYDLEKDLAESYKPGKYLKSLYETKKSNNLR
jgi:hypothetical protein